MRIVQAKLEDVDSIQRLNKRYFHSSYPDVETKAFITATIKSHTYWVAKSHKSHRNIGAMGCTLCYDMFPYLTIDALCVSTKYQGKGIGSKLIKEMENNV